MTHLIFFLTIIGSITSWCFWCWKFWLKKTGDKDEALFATVFTTLVSAVVVIISIGIWLATA